MPFIYNKYKEKYFYLNTSHQYFSLIKIMEKNLIFCIHFQND